MIDRDTQLTIGDSASLSWRSNTQIGGAHSFLSYSSKTCGCIQWASPRLTKLSSSLTGMTLCFRLLSWFRSRVWYLNLLDIRYRLVYKKESKTLIGMHASCWPYHRKMDSLSSSQMLRRVGYRLVLKSLCQRRLNSWEATLRSRSYRLGPNTRNSTQDNTKNGRYVPSLIWPRS